MSTNDKGSQWRINQTAERLGLTPPAKLVLNTQQLARALNEAPLDLSGLHHWSGGKINQERPAPATADEGITPATADEGCAAATSAGPTGKEKPRTHHVFESVISFLIPQANTAELEETLRVHISAFEEAAHNEGEKPIDQQVEKPNDKEKSAQAKQ